MAKVSVYLPDDLKRRAESMTNPPLNMSRTLRRALIAELRERGSAAPPDRHDEAAEEDVDDVD